MLYRQFDQDYTFKKLVFLCPLWLAVILVALLVTLIVWIVFKLRKKHQRKNSHSLSPDPEAKL